MLIGNLGSASLDVSNKKDSSTYDHEISCNIGNDTGTMTKESMMSHLPTQEFGVSQSHDHAIDKNGTISDSATRTNVPTDLMPNWNQIGFRSPFKKADFLDTPTESTHMLLSKSGFFAKGNNENYNESNDTKDNSVSPDNKRRGSIVRNGHRRKLSSVV